MTTLITASTLLPPPGGLDPANVISALKAAIGLGFVIFVHELGHFLVAKACGVKCEKFYVGFDVPLGIGPLKLPAALFKKQWGETEYGIGIIPLGGYVKMLGQDDNPANAAKEAERIEKDGELGDQLDPRSYPAKSVPQRMAIISAGVIMNLIFAVIFATVAYKMGVNYTPCIVGTTMPGDPAWKANLMPGDRLIQLGHDGQRSDHLRFRYDLRFKVIKTGEGNDCDLLVQRTDGTEEWITVRPTTPLKKETGLPTIGVTAATSNKIDEPLIELDTPFEATDLTVGDRITEMEFGGKSFEVKDGADIERLLLQHPGAVAKLTVVTQPKEKDAPETTRTVELGVRPMRVVGIVPGVGDIVAIQTDSPAERAGLKAGDRVLKIDGQPLGNPATLDQRLMARVGQSVTLTVRQQAGDDIEIEITPREPLIDGAARLRNGPTSLETLGLAFEVTRQIVDVIEGSPAAAAGLQVGDQLTEVTFVAPEESKKSVNLLGQFRLNKPLDLSKDEGTWAWVFQTMQSLPDDVKLDVKVRRGEATKTASLSPVASSVFFNPERGVSLKGATECRTASSFSEAIGLGVRETREGIMQVFLTLRKIKDLWRNVGGPGMIAAAATSEASEGWPRLLVFLTLLSANLAVLNFLPIPVLDGGHMMFLAYEGLMGKPVNERIAFGLTMLGLSFILGLMVYVIGMDVYRFGFNG